MADKGLWIFGYGSLMWNPGFHYSDSKIGHIRGYSRKFWQGNDFHRGTPDRPGRVATLVDESEGITWGRAFLLKDEQCTTSLSYLENRECQLGGYSTRFVHFQPRDQKEEPFPVLVYIAHNNNRLFLGPTPLHKIASEIATSSGNCGHNAEYLLKLAYFMRENVPEYWDDHLFVLEHLVKDRLKEQNIPLRNFLSGLDDFSDAHNLNGNEEPLDSPSTSRMDFSSSIPSRKLRCLDI